MFIETTLHVHKIILDKLDRAVSRNLQSRSYLIKFLIQRIMKDHQKMIKTYSRIKYQERDKKENWNRIHIVLTENEYEYFLDIRKFFKMSVSYILALAVISYLDEMLKWNYSTDNYFYKNYVFIMKTIDGTICWQQYWGIPKKLDI